MLNICRLENGLVVEGPFGLPRRLEKISIGQSMREAQSVDDLTPEDRQALMLIGFPATDIVTSPYDAETQKPDGYAFEILIDRVIATPIIIPLTLEELDARALIANTQYLRDREAEYPEIGGQLDAIWKQFEADRAQGKVLLPETNDLLDARLAVEAAHPKPATG